MRNRVACATPLQEMAPVVPKLVALGASPRLSTSRQPEAGAASTTTRKSVLGFLGSMSVEPEALAEPHFRKSASATGSVSFNLVEGT